MLAVLFLVLLTTCLLAPWLGVDSSDAADERRRPRSGWYPAAGLTGADRH